MPTIPVRARLVERGKQLPIVGADVMLSVDNNSSSIQKVKTDLDGHFWARMPPGKLTITANRMSENELVIFNFHPSTFALKPAATSLDIGAISVQLVRIQ
ncbi:MAG: hypothetical protein IT423_08665 [Pirellulaceae bacterium]|nr:hypothetical protein [Pirellulaceae bacterium]